MALPKWLDAQPNISYKQEKQALRDVEKWGRPLKWLKASSRGLDFDSRTEADLVLRNGSNLLRFAVAQKFKSSEGQIRLQAVPTFREAMIVWRSKSRAWSVELGGIDIGRDWNKESFNWLIEQMFRQ